MWRRRFRERDVDLQGGNLKGSGSCMHGGVFPWEVHIYHVSRRNNMYNLFSKFWRPAISWGGGCFLLNVTERGGVWACTKTSGGDPTFPVGKAIDFH